jgi:competence ComEA-like helix-hairpin-helix protein
MRIRTDRVWPAALAVASGLTLVCTAQEQSDLPVGPGRQQVQKICSGCHAFTVITHNQASRERWGEIVDNMVSRGAEATDSEIEQVINYLVAHFGPASKVNVNQAGAQELAQALDLTSKVAVAIVEYRDKSGAFKDLEQLAKVPGIDRKKLAEHKDSIVF